MLRIRQHRPLADGERGGGASAAQVRLSAHVIEEPPGASCTLRSTSVKVHRGSWSVLTRLVPVLASLPGAATGACGDPGLHDPISGDSAGRAAEGVWIPHATAAPADRGEPAHLTETIVQATDTRAPLARREPGRRHSPDFARHQGQAAGQPGRGGDLAVIGTTLQIVGGSPAEGGRRARGRAGARRRGWEWQTRRPALRAASLLRVTSTDYVPDCSTGAAARAAGGRTASHLPGGRCGRPPVCRCELRRRCCPRSGAMCSAARPRPPSPRKCCRCCATLRRPHRPLANWTPGEASSAQLFKVIGAYLPPAGQDSSPRRCGEPEPPHRGTLPGPQWPVDIQRRRRHSIFRYASSARIGFRSSSRFLRTDAASKAAARRSMRPRRSKLERDIVAAGTIERRRQIVAGRAGEYLENRHRQALTRFCQIFRSKEIVMIA